MNVLEVNQLYLLEIFVESVLIPKSSSLPSEMDRREPLPPLSITVDFHRCPLLEVTQPESTRRSTPLEKRETITVLMCSGKACLFATTPSAFMKSMSSYNGRIELFYRKPKSGFPINIGRTDVYADGFAEELHMSPEPSKFPVSAFLYSTFPVHNSSRRYVGDVTVFLRFACYGRSVINALRMGEEKSPTLYYRGQETVGDHYGIKCEQCTQFKDMPRAESHLCFQQGDKSQESYYVDLLSGSCLDIAKMYTTTNITPVRESRKIPKMSEIPGMTWPRHISSMKSETVRSSISELKPRQSSVPHPLSETSLSEHTNANVERRSSVKHGSSSKQEGDEEEPKLNGILTVPEESTPGRTSRSERVESLKSNSSKL